MYLLRYVVKCTVTDLLFNTKASCSKCPPSAWIHFDLCDQRTCNVMKHCSIVDAFFAGLRICWSSSSLVFFPCGIIVVEV